MIELGHGSLSCHIWNINRLVQVSLHALWVKSTSELSGVSMLANDVLLLSNSLLELQHMLNFVPEYSSLHRYNTHQTKRQVCDTS